MRGICILGSSGSVGSNCLQILANAPDEFRLVGCSAHTNVQHMQSVLDANEQVKVCLSDKQAHAKLLSLSTKHAHKILSPDEEGLLELCLGDEVDTIIAAQSGIGSLAAVLASLQAGKRVLLANKELLLVAGHLLADYTPARAHKHYADATLLPIDSELFALYELLENQNKCIKKVFLPASGGAVHKYNNSQLSRKQVLDHPVWDMGMKITVNSSTMANKLMELIEAAHLFNLNASQLSFLLHPQAIVHALAEFSDGSLHALLANADMSYPITSMLYRPQILSEAKAGRVSLAQLANLSFAKINQQTYPLAAISEDLLSALPNNDLSLIFCASNECAVNAFLDNKISFAQISEIVLQSLAKPACSLMDSTQDISERFYSVYQATQSSLPH